MKADFPAGSDGKVSAYNAEDLGSIPGLGRSPGERNGNPAQYSCLENPTDGGPWPTTVHGSQSVGHNLSNFPPHSRWSKISAALIVPMNYGSEKFKPAQK